MSDGERESKLSWQALLSDLKKRGLAEGPKLAAGDGALGFWCALEEEFPGVQCQRCWVHKTANVLDKLPKKLQPTAKAHLHEMYLSPTRADAEQSYQRFFNEKPAQQHRSRSGSLSGGIAARLRRPPHPAPH